MLLRLDANKQSLGRDDASTYTCLYAWPTNPANVSIPTCMVDQNRIYAPYMTVYFVVNLPETLCIHRIYMVLANPTYFPRPSSLFLCCSNQHKFLLHFLLLPPSFGLPCHCERLLHYLTNISSCPPCVAPSKLCPLMSLLCSLPCDCCSSPQTFFLLHLVSLPPSPAFTVTVSHHSTNIPHFPP